MPFSKCLRAKIYSNMNVHFDPQGCQTLLLKESDPLLFSLGSWTMSEMTRLSLIRSSLEMYMYIHCCKINNKQYIFNCDKIHIQSTPDISESKVISNY